MTSDEIRIEHINVKELPEFAERVLSEAEKGQFIPITMQRAVAHAHNPYASKDDIGLLVAVDSQEEIVGYFGVLPLLLRNGEGYHKVHWFTTWSVSPQVRGQGVGSQLMAAALDLKQDYLIVGSVHARRVCRKFGFWERSPLIYYWLDATGMSRLNPLVWLRRAYRKLLHVLRVDKKVRIHTPWTERVDGWVGPTFKRFFYTRLLEAQTPLLAGIRFREVDQLPSEQLTRQARPKVQLHRGVEIVNWMLKYPWVVTSGKSITEDMDYYFSDARPLFRFIALEVYSQEDQYKGFVVFSVSQKGSGCC